MYLNCAVGGTVLLAASGRRAGAGFGKVEETGGTRRGVAVLDGPGVGARAASIAGETISSVTVAARGPARSVLRTGISTPSKRIRLPLSFALSARKVARARTIYGWKAGSSVSSESGSSSQLSAGARKTEGSISKIASVSGDVSERMPAVTVDGTATAWPDSWSRQSLRQRAPWTRGIRFPSGR